ncbi:scopoletin glucosyltransferase [Artemisia annua]|uniref:Scopoletin glucosyltransferase n=1 Tax=Artemisia annua TaxID=35608 RepID=A0A2U1QCI0_ARTAN|nr:scopoletin glucosyltransferase [Artemisia annua]
MKDSCHIAFFPFAAYGHMIPMAHMAVLFASRGLQTTIITTQETAHRFTELIGKTINYDHLITLHIIELKAAEACLPPGLENSDKPVPSQDITSVFDVIYMLQEPFEQFIQQARPNCIVADMFYPWTTKIAAKYNIPRIVFNGTGFFPLCVVKAMRVYDPARDISSDSEPFIVPHLPHKIMLTKKQLARIEEVNIKGFVKVLIEASAAEVTSYGVVMNSFYELEPEYALHYREVIKRKAWHIGPVSLVRKNIEDKLERGRESGIDEHKCLKWLDSKGRDSVVYVSFGTVVTVTSSQLYEIAMGLEACDKNFIWVIKKDEEKSFPEGFLSPAYGARSFGTMVTVTSSHLYEIAMGLEACDKNFIWVIKKDEEKSFPEGFEARMKAKGKGLIIKGWAPQVLILDHESVGGFVNHCGWNSVLEGIGVSIGDVEWSATSRCEGVKGETIANAVARLMGTEEGQEMRRRARVLKDKAKTAIEEGGSSYSDLTAFINEIKALSELS